MVDVEDSDPALVKHVAIDRIVLLRSKTIAEEQLVLMKLMLLGNMGVHLFHANGYDNWTNDDEAVGNFLATAQTTERRHAEPQRLFSTETVEVLELSDENPETMHRWVFAAALGMDQYYADDCEPEEARWQFTVSKKDSKIREIALDVAEESGIHPVRSFHRLADLIERVGGGITAGGDAPDKYIKILHKIDSAEKAKVIQNRERIVALQEQLKTQEAKTSEVQQEASDLQLCKDTLGQELSKVKTLFEKSKATVKLLQTNVKELEKKLKAAEMKRTSDEEPGGATSSSE